MLNGCDKGETVVVDTSKDLIEFTGLTEGQVSRLIQRDGYNARDEFDDCTKKEDSDHWFYLGSRYFIFENAIHTQDIEDCVNKLLPANARIWEYGGGTGNLSLMLASRGYDVSFTELNSLQKDFVEFRAGKYNQNIRHINSWEAKPENYFDLVIALDILEHIPEYHLALQQICDSVKPGGLIWEYSPFQMNENNPTHRIADHHNYQKILTQNGFKLIRLAQRGYVWKKNASQNREVDEYGQGRTMTRDEDMITQAQHTSHLVIQDISLDRSEKTEEPRFSFVMIVLNGMPFIEYSLKSVYDFAYEIIIVEGSVEQCGFAANPDGSSTDGTVECIKSFPDPQNKIRFIQGTWPEKCEMQNRALEYVTGNYVWLLDSDEIYKKKDLFTVKELIEKDNTITQVNFIPDNFWKGLDYIFVSPVFFNKIHHYRRLFKYMKGAVFTSHRPPTMVWPDSSGTTEQRHLIDGFKTRKMGIKMFHYSYVTDKQVRQKIDLYNRYGWGKNWNIDLNSWYRDCFQQWTPQNRDKIDRTYPIWTGDERSHTQPFRDTHPEVMKEFMENKGEVRQDIKNSHVTEEETLSVIGDTCFQKKVVEAWKLIEIDDPVKHRRNLMLQNIEQNRNFWNIHVALAFLADKLKPERYLEVGVRTGCSLVQVLAHSNVREVVAMDMWTGNYAGMSNTMEYTKGQIERFISKTSRQFTINFIHGDSHDKMKALIKSSRKFDLITIDGDHSEAGAMEDLDDAIHLLDDRGAIVFDDILNPSCDRLIYVAEQFHEKYPYLNVLINSKQDNGCVIFLKNIETGELLKKKNKKKEENIPNRLKVASDYNKGNDLTKIDTASNFAESIHRLFSRIKPTKIIETGTYLGTGTTTVIAASLKVLGINAEFFTIEVNPKHYMLAKKHFETKGLNVIPLHGLSVPRTLLPTLKEIERDCVTDVSYKDIFVDHQAHNRAQRYLEETDFDGVEENLLYRCLERFDFKPDFVLLDSAGHMGNVEFNYLIKHVRASCYIALDDIGHIKHHASYQQIQEDNRFEIIHTSHEKFGFCIAQFTPHQTEGEVT